jgi:phosphatidylglycerophosphate synthase
MVIPASPLGKGTMVSQVVSIFLLLLARPLPALRPLAVVGLWVVLVLTVVSGFDYFRRFFFEGARAEKTPAPEAGTGESSARA